MGMEVPSGAVPKERDSITARLGAVGDVVEWMQPAANSSIAIAMQANGWFGAGGRGMEAYRSGLGEASMGLA